MQKTMCKDHLGNEYSSVASMCKHWGIGKNLYSSRIARGWDIEKALTTRAEEKIIVDHLGNRFNSYKEMCKHWGVKQTTFLARLDKGLSIKDSLTMETSHVSKECKDHTGKVFKSRREMCKYWGIKQTTFLARLDKGLDIEQALTRDKFGIKCTDHLGQSFDSLDSMCKYWGVGVLSFKSRIKNGWSISEALTTPTSSKETVCKDHLGNEFDSVNKMLEHWGISYVTFYYRIRKGWNLKDALTTPATRQKKNFIAFGKEFSVGSASREFNVTETNILNRFNHQWDIEASLVVTCNNEGNPNVRIQFIGLDGKAYYKAVWSKEPVTARQIIEHYRPDLLEAYDKYNSTGEYRPYKEGDKPCTP